MSDTLSFLFCAFCAPILILASNKNCIVTRFHSQKVAMSSQNNIQQIFVGGYDHAIDSFVFDEEAGTLTKTSSSLESKLGPSWQYLVPEHKLLFSGCEGPEGGIGYLDSYRVAEDGALHKIDRKECVQGCVSMDMGKNGFLVTSS